MYTLVDTTFGMYVVSLHENADGTQAVELSTNPVAAKKLPTYGEAVSFRKQLYNPFVWNITMVQQEAA